MGAHHQLQAMCSLVNVCACDCACLRACVRWYLPSVGAGSRPIRSSRPQPPPGFQALHAASTIASSGAQALGTAQPAQQRRHEKLSPHAAPFIGQSPQYAWRGATQPSNFAVSPYDISNAMLKPMELPKFSGKAADYVQWRRRFLQVVNTSWPEEYQMARLREALSGGQAYDLIADLLEGPGAYYAAWQELESWFGGSDRHLEQQIRELMNYPRVASERDVDSLQKYAVKLRSLIANMQLCGSSPGAEMAIIATEKIPKTMLIRYFERYGNGNTDIQQLATWLLEKVKTARYATDRSESSDRPSPGGRKEQYRSTKQQSLLTTESPSRPPPPDKRPYRPPQQHQSGKQSCRKCTGPHRIEQCNQFKGMPVAKRKELVLMLGLCMCCLEAGHWARDCSRSGCSQCGGKHHQALHFSQKTESPPARQSSASVASPQVKKEATNTAVPATSTSTMASGLTSFMISPVKVSNGKATVTANVLLDSGSSCSYVSERLAKKLQLNGIAQKVSVGVIGGKILQREMLIVRLRIQHQDSNAETELDAYVIPKVTADVPVVDWNTAKTQWTHIADIDFPPVIRSGLDMLIGLNAPRLHQADEERHGSHGPIARKTPIGWVCFGPVVQREPQSSHVTFHSADFVTSELDRVVKNFWSLDAVGMSSETSPSLTVQEKTAEESTLRNLQYEDGRFTVGIPWTNGAREPDLTSGSNRKMAEHRLISLLRSLDRRPGLRVKYAGVLEDYLKKSYVRKVTTEEVELCGNNQWFLPHFPVVREDKVTTKVRVVYDAAARYNNISINDLMLPGPKLQNDLVRILLQFCMEPVVLIGDISEMFLQVSLIPSDRKYHRFLWQSDQGMMEVYEFTRLAFGMKASPYLACRALLQTAEKFGHEFDPVVTDIVQKSFYVDDLLRSLPEEQHAVQARIQTQTLLEKGGFKLRKWLSNSPTVMASIPPELQGTTSKPIEERGSAVASSTKTLGITWIMNGDCFTFQYANASPTKLTKRTVLSRMAALFDPRGHLAPFTIRAKLMFQESCIAGIGWDDELPPELGKAWRAWFSQFECLSTLRIRRCFKAELTGGVTTTLHVFTDASMVAYAAAVYVRTQDAGGNVVVTLAMAKARAAPIKRRSIPFLELQGAVLGTRLGKYVSSALGVSAEEVSYWTDSMNVMYWVRSLSRRFTVEVGNRISEIQQNSEPANWHHVPGKINPADLPSRGVAAQQLVDEDAWWTGPAFLSQEPEDWPQREILVPATLPCLLKKEQAPITLHATMLHPDSMRLHPENYSSWTRLVRITAWCRRFVARLKSGHQNEEREVHSQPVKVSPDKTVDVPSLTAGELLEAEYFWIGYAQREKYGDVVKILEQSKALPASSPLLKLCPRIEAHGDINVMKVGGRLRTAHHLTSDFRSPIILPQHRVTELIIRQEDERCKHSIGTNHVLSNLADRFWLVKGKQMVKKYRTSCVGCQKIWRKPVEPVMGQLPNYRTEGPFLAFSNTAVDFAGPFYVKRGRGRPQEKRYAALFTCLQSRACHLEMVSSLDAEGFKMALSRFCSRRGCPKMVLSDNGTNFVATERELRDAVATLEKSAFGLELAARGIEWKFNPPRAAHFGGVFERMVRAMKQVLQTTLYRADLTEEELNTALVQAEGLLNSRPLTVMSSDVNDARPLTPNHFLVGHVTVTTALEDDSDSVERTHPRRRWMCVQHLLRTVWKRWLREIVARLNIRGKWFREKRNVEVGNILLVLDDTVPRGRWPLGRVVAVYPGKDGVVRVVDVQVNGKVYRRSVHRLVPLDVTPVGSTSDNPTAEIALEDAV